MADSKSFVSAAEMARRECLMAGQLMAGTEMARDIVCAKCPGFPAPGFPGKKAKVTPTVASPKKAGRPRVCRRHSSTSDDEADAAAMSKVRDPTTVEQVAHELDKMDEVAKALGVEELGAASKKALGELTESETESIEEEESQEAVEENTQGLENTQAEESQAVSTSQ